MTPSTFIDIHVLQTVPPSNLNRDDTGTPKSAVYGGARRARVSSQAWKRATRRDFEEHLDASNLALRTKRVLEQIVARVLAAAPQMEPAEAARRGVTVLKALGLKLEPPRTNKDKDAQKQPGEPTLTEYLVFFSNRQLDRLAELAATNDGKVSPKDAKAAADQDHGIEVALFGRMVADAADLNVDAAAQVAHAISTHAVDVEHDYFTAVDDKAPEDNSGAGMIGTVEFNSATLYRYATVALDRLVENLGDNAAAVRATQAFAQAFITSMPTGKQNTFGNRTPVDAVLVMVRHGQPINLVGAFEDPVVSTGNGYVAASAATLAAYAKTVDKAMGTPPARVFVVVAKDAAAPLRELGDVMTLPELTAAIGTALADKDA